MKIITRRIIISKVNVCLSWTKLKLEITTCPSTKEMQPKLLKCVCFPGQNVNERIEHDSIKNNTTRIFTH